MTKKKDDKRLVWKLKEQPTAEGVSRLVEQGVIDKDEAREIVVRETTEDTDEVKALKEMVDTLKEAVEEMLKNKNVQVLPYTKVVEVPSRLGPYWDKHWVTSSNHVFMNSTSGSSGNTTYELSVGQ